MPDRKRRSVKPRPIARFSSHRGGRSKNRVVSSLEHVRSEARGSIRGVETGYLSSRRIGGPRISEAIIPLDGHFSLRAAVIRYPGSSEKKQEESARRPTRKAFIRSPVRCVDAPRAPCEKSETRGTREDRRRRRRRRRTAPREERTKSEAV